VETETPSVNSISVNVRQSVEFVIDYTDENVQVLNVVLLRCEKFVQNVLSFLFISEGTLLLKSREESGRSDNCLGRR